MKNTITEMRSALDRLINRLVMAKERISELESMSIENPQIYKALLKLNNVETNNSIKKWARSSHRGSVVNEPD